MSARQPARGVHPQGMGRVRCVHFVGIGGAGMSGIAEVLHNLGYRVSGSDMRESAVTRRLAAMGYLSSYSHAGRYYTLERTPDFDRDGLLDLYSGTDTSAPPLAPMSSPHDFSSNWYFERDLSLVRPVVIRCYAFKVGNVSGVQPQVERNRFMRSGLRPPYGPDVKLRLELLVIPCGRQCSVDGNDGIEAGTRVAPPHC